MLCYFHPQKQQSKRLCANAHTHKPPGLQVQGPDVRPATARFCILGYYHVQLPLWNSLQAMQFPLQHLSVMCSKRPWATIAAVSALFVVGSSGARADPQANCSAGWEWVCSIRDTPPRTSRGVHGVRVFVSALIWYTFLAESEFA